MNQAFTKLPIFSLNSVQMRTFHITWLMFFVCFFGWFGLAPLMPTIRAELHLTKDQIGNIIIASVSSTILARLFIGKLCDIWGPRKTAIALLLMGSIPVFLVGLSHDYSTFLLFRFLIGILGASFVITQFHTSLMFAPNIKGTANAVAGGWGNLGGGITNMLMPVIFSMLVAFGYTKASAWRYSMLVPGTLLLIMAFLYYKYTQDTPSGNFDEIGHRENKKPTNWNLLLDWRIWALTLAYAVCFGMEITFDNVASLHFVDTFHVNQAKAGLYAGIFGAMNLFARALGGIFSDRVGSKFGLKGKGVLLSLVLFLEGLGILLFAHSNSLLMAIASMLFFALFLKMANGATYGIVPFMNQENLGMVTGIVGAGGNLGGMIFGFLFKSSKISYAEAFTYIGFTVLIVSILVLITRFQKSTVEEPILVPNLSGTASAINS